MDVVLFVHFPAVLASVCLAIRYLFPVARRYRFVDMPNTRKRHRRPTPLIGGFAVLIGLFVALSVSGLLAEPLWLIFFAAALTLTVLGSVDDVLDISPRLRFVLQGLVVTAALFGADLAIEQLGLLLGTETLYLGFALGLGFTVVCALASINAYNMIDGIDGLAGSVTAATLLGVMVLSLLSGAPELALVAGSLALALLAFLAFNLEMPFFRGRKIFLGDGGSTFLGFLVLWLLVVASQKDISFRPITAVWLVGLPIVDMLTVFARRAFAGKSPFSADRTHIHHLLMESGMSARQTLLVLLGFHASLVAFGVAGEMLYWSDLIMTLGAIGAGALYGAVNISLTSRQQKAAVSPQQQ